MGLLFSNSLRLPGAAADLWEEQIDTESTVLVGQVSLQLCNLFAEHVWCIANLSRISSVHCLDHDSSYASDDTHTAGICHGSSQLRPCCNVHASKEDWVLDLQEIRKSGLELLR